MISLPSCQLGSKFGVPQEVWGISHTDLVFSLLRESKKAWNVVDKRIDVMLSDRWVAEVQKSHIDECMSKLRDKFGLKSRIGDMSIIEHWYP
jgi:hypothetical protein